MLSKAPIQHCRISTRHIYTYRSRCILTIQRNSRHNNRKNQRENHQICQVKVSKPYTSYPSAGHIQSSDRKFLTINTLVHVRTASATTAMGKKMQLTTINLVPWYSGLTKLDVLPGGGGMAGVISAMLLFYVYSVLYRVVRVTVLYTVVDAYMPGYTPE